MIINLDRLLKEFEEMLRKHTEEERADKLPTYDCMLDFEHDICRQQQCRYCSFVRPQKND